MLKYTVIVFTKRRIVGVSFHFLVKILWLIVISVTISMRIFLKLKLFFIVYIHVVSHSHVGLKPFPSDWKFWASPFHG